MTKFFANLEKVHFDAYLEVVQNFLTVKILAVSHWRDAEYRKFRHPIEMLDILYHANKIAQLHPWQEFYQDGINQLLASNDELLLYDHAQWFMNRVARGEIEGDYHMKISN